MSLTQSELEAAASDVIQTLQVIPQFASCKVAIIGGLALWKYMPTGRTTDDVDFIININDAPKSVKTKLLALPNSRFEEQSQYFLYKTPSGKRIQIDITPQFQSPYFPTAAKTVSSIPNGSVPYISATDLIVFKIHSCGLRAENVKKRRDALDAVVLLEQETKAGALRLTQEQKSAVQQGLGDVVPLSGKDMKWWSDRLGI